MCPIFKILSQTLGLNRKTERLVLIGYLLPVWSSPSLRPHLLGLNIPFPSCVFPPSGIGILCNKGINVNIVVFERVTEF